MEIKIGITALISSLALLAGHYFPWRAIINRRLPRPAAYTYGVLAILLPASGFMALHGMIQAMAAVWAAALAGGGTVMLCYALDDWLENRRRRQEAEEREALTLRQLDDQRSAQPEG